MIKVCNIASMEEITQAHKDRWERMLKEGCVFLYPTETVYGLGTSPFVEEGVAKIYRLKMRQDDKAFLLIAATMEDAKKGFAEWNPVAEKLAMSFWPGPFTMVLRASSLVPTSLRGNTGKVGVRVSSHPIAGLLAYLAGGLIISTSANISGEPPIVEISTIPPAMIKDIDMIIDSGPIKGKPSTIVDCSEGYVRLIREGDISALDIQRSLGEIKEIL